MSNLDFSQFDDQIIHSFPVINLVIYFHRAIDDRHWLEAIVLAHMYIETQLRAIEGKNIRKGKNTPKDEKIIVLAKNAYNKKNISEDLFNKINGFNSKRNDAVHNIASGVITYDQLEQTAIDAGTLIDELRVTYMDSYNPKQNTDNLTVSALKQSA